MSTSADVLWRLNNEYRKRLAMAQTYLDLLDQLVLMQNGERQAHTVAALGYARQCIETMTEAHRQWRQRFYYESGDTKRMVQEGRAINQALARFAQMRTQQEHYLNELYATLNNIPRPDPKITRVPNGDLWLLTQSAINSLVGFEEYLTDLPRVN
jgi:hypothetical protein